MTAWPEGYDRVLLGKVDSTMAESARRAPDLRRPTWMLAKRQTAGRGRRGRVWATPAGNFAATLAMRPTEPPAVVALRSFVAALALHDAFSAAAGGAGDFALKWPNDVLLNGGKVAGILLENFACGGAFCNLAIGFGANLAEAPELDSLEPGALRPVSLKGETGRRVVPEDFLEMLAFAYADREANFATFGFDPTRAAWLERAARLGEPVAARTPAGETCGVFETVDETGALILATGRGRAAIAAADVHFPDRRSATAIGRTG